MEGRPIAPALLAWYEREGRDLPWRRTRDPYLIWLSEVILQQTRVAQGMDYYLRFTARWPDVGSLAAASEDEVLKQWQGLGYYSRARNLHAAARQVVERFGGVFPQTVEEVRSLRGGGEYTAAAICSAACDAPCAVVDGNVYRVLARLFDLDLPIDTTAGRRAFAALAQEELDAEHPGLYNQAIMDFGALQCTPAAPRCGDCPFADRCLALAAGTVVERPVRRQRTAVRERWFNYLHLTCRGEVALRRRGVGDIWQGLWEFPMIETEGPEAFEALCGGEAFARWVGPGPWRLAGTVAMAPHRLTHRTLRAVFHRIEVDAWSAEAAPLALGAAEAEGKALPRLVARYLEREPLI